MIGIQTWRSQKFSPNLAVTSTSVMFVHFLQSSLAFTLISILHTAFNVTRPYYFICFISFAVRSFFLLFVFFKLSMHSGLLNSDCNYCRNYTFYKVRSEYSQFDSFESRGDTFFEDAKFQYANRDILIVKGRDFLITRMHRKLDKGYITVGRSFELADIPETRANVRY